jgi:hypothetical protein
METTTQKTPTSSGDGPDKTPARGAERPETAAAAGEAPREVSHLLSADGSKIPIERDSDEASRDRGPAMQRGFGEWRKEAVDRLVNAGPSSIAVMAFAAGLLAGAFVGVLWARR